MIETFELHFNSHTEFDNSEPKIHYSNGLERFLYSKGWRIQYASKCFSDRWWSNSGYSILINNNSFNKMKYLPEGEQQMQSVECWITEKHYNKEAFDSINFIPDNFISR